MPKLSIIVPVYKVEQYIHKCVDSILNQTFTDFELILVDDGSPDNCGAICDEYAQKDERVRVIHKENGGLSDARNVGLDIAIGEYISFIDSDDYIASDMYDTMISELILNNADMVKCGFTEFDDEGKEYKSIAFGKVKVFDNNHDRSALLNFYFDSVLYKISCNAIYTRELARKVKFPKGLINEDNYSAGMYLFFAKRILCIPEEFYFYRVNPSGLSKSVHKKRLLDIAVVTANLHEDLLKEGFQNTDILKRIRRKMAREIFHCAKYSKDGVFKLCSMDREFYNLVLSELDLRRRLEMKLYKLIGLFELK